MIKRTLPAIAAIILFISYPGAGMAQAAGTEEEHTYLIGFKESLDVGIIAEAGGETGDTWDRIDAGEAELSPSEASWLSSHSAVEYVEKDRVVQVAQSDNLKNWGIENVKAPDAWDVDVTGKNIEVAVVDTGISTSHPSLAVADGFSSVSYTDSYDDDNGHGTHAAGIIAANDPENGLVGVAPDAKLIAVKVLDESGNGSLTQVLTGIDWAIDQGVDIINMSFGTLTDSNTMREMLDEAYNSGILTIAASGNRGESSATSDRVEYPARYSTVVAVGAVDQNNKRASFSASGEAVELVAPGVDIVSTYKGSAYGSLSGTSMATPFVAGAFALLKEAYPDKEAVVLRGMLQDEALDLGGYGRDTEYGYGLLQIPDLTDAPSIPDDEETEEPAEKPNDDSEEDPVEKDIEDNPIEEDPIELPEIPYGVEGKVIYADDGTADVHIDWDYPESEDVASYNVYKNHAFFAEVQEEKFFKDENVEPGTYTYHITAIDGNGQESEKSESVEVKVEDHQAPFSWPSRIDNPPSYSDVNDQYWAAESIRELSARGIIQGSDGSFRPGEPVRRGQSLAMIGRLLDWENKRTDTRFPDVDADYFGSGYIKHAIKAGYVSGFSDGTFRPNQDITRGQMAAILGDVFGFSSEPTDRFSDVGKDTTGRSAIAYLAEHHIISGYDDGTFEPGAPLTRAQFASIFYELGEHLKER